MDFQQAADLLNIIGIEYSDRRHLASAREKLEEISQLYDGPPEEWPRRWRIAKDPELKDREILRQIKEVEVLQREHLQELKELQDKAASMGISLETLEIAEGIRVTGNLTAARALDLACAVQGVTP